MNQKTMRGRLFSCGAQIGLAALVSMGASAGQTVRLHFSSTEDASVATSFLIDDTSLE